MVESALLTIIPGTWQNGTEEALEGQMHTCDGSGKTMTVALKSWVSAVILGMIFKPAFLCLQFPIFKMGAITVPYSLIVSLREVVHGRNFKKHLTHTKHSMMVRHLGATKEYKIVLWLEAEFLTPFLNGGSAG